MTEKPKKPIPFPAEEFEEFVRELGEVKNHMDAALKILERALKKVDQQAKQSAY